MFIGLNVANAERYGHALLSELLSSHWPFCLASSILVQWLRSIALADVRDVRVFLPCSHGKPVVKNLRERNEGPVELFTDKGMRVL